MLVMARLCMVLAAVLVLAAASAQGLPVPNVLDAASPNAREVAGLFWWVMGFSALVLAVVVIFLGAGIWRGWRERELAEEPPQTHGNLALEVTWTAAPLLILLFLLYLTITSLYRLDGMAAPEEAITVNVVGQQFWWEMNYPDKGIITANELVVPVGRPVRLVLVATDVMHSFWIPQLGGKIDLIPGNKRVMWFTPDREGIYHGQCAELCGDSHANMRLRAVVLSPEAFDAWKEAARQPAEPPTDALAQQGKQLFLTKGCIGCHAVQGVNAFNRTGPDLSHVGSRTSIASAMFDNTRENMIRWLLYTDTVKPGNLMPNMGLSLDEAEALTAYMESLTLPGIDMQALIETSLTGSSLAAVSEEESRE